MYLVYMDIDTRWIPMSSPEMGVGLARWRLFIGCANEKHLLSLIINARITKQMLQYEHD